MDWAIEDTIGNWWRPNFEAPQVNIYKPDCALEFKAMVLQNSDLFS